VTSADSARTTLRASNKVRQAQLVAAERRSTLMTGELDSYRRDRDNLRAKIAQLTEQTAAVIAQTRNADESTSATRAKKEKLEAAQSKLSQRERDSLLSLNAERARAALAPIIF
jgi:hypothetical protein